MNLIHDWTDLCIVELRDYLINGGCWFSKNHALDNIIRNHKEFSNQERMAIAINFYSFRERIPNFSPRAVFFCKDIKVPVKFRSGWRQLLDDIREGRNLLSRMSRQSRDIDFCDGLLTDWGIYHFHLGDTTTSDGMVSRTGKLAYVYMTPSAAYIIAICNHGKWEDRALLEMLCNDYPHALEDWRIDTKDLSINFSATDIKKLRGNRINTFIKIKETVYLSPGGGVCGNGISVKAIRQAYYDREFLHFVEQRLKSCFKNNKPFGLTDKGIENYILYRFCSGPDWFLEVISPNNDKIIHFTDSEIRLLPMRSIQSVELKLAVTNMPHMFH